MGFAREFDPSLYSKYYLLSCVPESKVQAAVMQSLSFTGIPAVEVDVGAKQLRGRAVGALQAAGRRDLLHKLKGKTGAGVAGLVDVIGAIPGALLGQPRAVPLFLEIKAPQWLHESPRTGRIIQKEKAGSLRPEQLAFLNTMDQAGAVCGVCWSVDDLHRILAGAGVNGGF